EVDGTMIPQVNVRMRCGRAAVAAVQIGQLPHVSSGNGFAVDDKIQVLKIVVMEEDVLIGAGGRVDDGVREIGEAVIVQWVWIQSREVIDPNTVCANKLAEFANQ